jgi:tetratricopeptide (TPR) repeat protein
MQEANDRDPRNLYAYTGWGLVLDEEQDHTGAIAKFQQALAIDPKFANAYNGWGIVLNEQQDYVGAIRYHF